jgi:hypothetical protein
MLAQEIARSVLQTQESVKLVEENLEIIFSLLKEEDIFKATLLNQHYDFYAIHMMNYLKIFDKKIVNASLLCKVVHYLKRIFRYIIEAHLGDSRVKFQ